MTEFSIKVAVFLFVMGLDIIIFDREITIVQSTTFILVLSLINIEP